MQQRLEDIDLNSRMSSLILTCEEFAKHPRNKDIEQVVVKVLNERVAGLNMPTDAVHAAHKLQNDSKVICRFVKRQLRDGIYDARLRAHQVPGQPRREAALHFGVTDAEKSTSV